MVTKNSQLAVRKRSLAIMPYLLDFRDKFDNNMYRPTRTDSQLNEHDEDDLQNRFYDGLVISRTAQQGTARLNAILNIDNNKTNPCGEYYEGSENDPVSGKYYLTGIVLPFLIFFYMLGKAGCKKEFHNISSLLKYIMAIGCCYCLFVYYLILLNSPSYVAY